MCPAFQQQELTHPARAARQGTPWTACPGSARAAYCYCQCAWIRRCLCQNLKVNVMLPTLRMPWAISIAVSVGASYVSVRHPGLMSLACRCFPHCLSPLYQALNMSQYPALPFDVLEKIIDTLADEDTPTFSNLKTFSLTSKSLLHSCRKHIFKTIIIGLPVPMDNIDEEDSDDDCIDREISPSRLCWLMSARPQLSEYVRVFKFGINCDPWTYHIVDSEFAPVLQRFTQLQSLTLDVKYYRGRPRDVTTWADIPPPIQKSVLFLIRLQTLTALTLRYHEFPLFKIEIAANLRCLHIDNVTIFEGEDAPINLLSNCVQPIFLHEYSMGYSCADTTTAILNAMLLNNRHMFEFSELWHLQAEIYSSPEDSDVAHNVVSKTSQLRTLDLTSEVVPLHPSIQQRVNISPHRSSYQSSVPCSILWRPHRISPFTHTDYNKSSLPHRLAHHSARWALHWVRGNMPSSHCAGRNIPHGSPLL